MDTPAISVVVALYNAEQYLPECVASIRACHDDALECVLINDGSTDGSCAICEKAVNEDPRFRLLNKENSGVSDSRNAGIRAARGKYIFFLDADDYIEAGVWLRILEYAHKAEADIVAFGYYSLFPSGYKQKQQYQITGEESFSPDDLRAALIGSPMLNTCWGKLLRRSVIEEHNLRFDTTLITCEDAVFMLDFIEKADTFILNNLCILCYRIHESSAMRIRSFEQKVMDFSTLFARRSAFLTHSVNPGLRFEMLRECFSVLTNLLLEFSAGHSIRETKNACVFTLLQSVTHDILEDLDMRGLSPFYKRLEYRWMSRERVYPLVVYFKIKSLFMRKHRLR